MGGNKGKIFNFKTTCTFQLCQKSNGQVQIQISPPSGGVRPTALSQSKKVLDTLASWNPFVLSKIVKFVCFLIGISSLDVLQNDTVVWTSI